MKERLILKTILFFFLPLLFRSELIQLSHAVTNAFLARLVAPKEIIAAFSIAFGLTIMASVFGMMLLPIAYVTFFMMMNTRKLLGEEKPRGIRMWIWNILMVPAMLGAILAAGSAIYSRMGDSTSRIFIISLGIAYGTRDLR